MNYFVSYWACVSVRMAWRCVGFLTVHVLVVLLEPSSQTAFDEICLRVVPDDVGKPWRDPPSNTRYLYVSRDQRNVIPPWKEFQRDNDGSSAVSNAEPINVSLLADSGSLLFLLSPNTTILSSVDSVGITVWSILSSVRIQEENSR